MNLHPIYDPPPKAMKITSKKSIQNNSKDMGIGSSENDRDYDNCC